MINRLVSHRPYEGEVDDGRRWLILKGSWSRRLTGKLNAQPWLYVNTALGSDPPDLTFLESVSGLQGLRVIGYRLGEADVAAIRRHALTCVVLSIDDLDSLPPFGDFPELRYLSGGYSPEVVSSISSAEALVGFHCDRSEVTELGELSSESLQWLDLSSATRLEALNGHFPDLEYLAISGARSLHSLAGLAQSCPRLKNLDLHGCTKVSSLEPLAEANRLTILDLDFGGVVDSLDPLGELQDLVQLAFGDRFSVRPGQTNEFLGRLSNLRTVFGRPTGAEATQPWPASQALDRQDPAIVPFKGGS